MLPTGFSIRKKRRGVQRAIKALCKQVRVPTDRIKAQSSIGFQPVICARLVGPSKQRGSR